MVILFSKYHGTGNDFIMIDDSRNIFPADGKIVSSLCDRRLGIGSDGLILMKRSKSFDFRMVYYNSDGQESTMCGNGGRCLAAFARRLGFEGSAFTFEAVDGIHQALIVSEVDSVAFVRLKMTDVEIPVNYAPDDIIDSGSPHLVRFVDTLEGMDVAGRGREIRCRPIFGTNGVNVNFVEIKKNLVKIRTYERGVEDETLSCGTGAVASVLAIAHRDKTLQSPVSLQTAGGELSVYFRRGNNVFSDIWLEGPASFVFQGEVHI